MSIKNKERMIDVIIPVHKKDMDTLEYCIDGIRKNIKNVRRIITVSKEPYTDKAEWFDEAKFPFSFSDVEEVLKSVGIQDSVGWHFQQLLKLYAAFVIPDILENVLIVDSDTVFFRKVRMLSFWKNLPLYNLSKDKNIYESPFSLGAFEHIKRLLPTLTQESLSEKDRQLYGICHHMLFQKHILEDLFRKVEEYDGTGDPFWKICLKHVEPNDSSILSEYEIYFSFLLHYYRDGFIIRKLRYKNTKDFNVKKYQRRLKYHYCSFHSYMRE